MVDQPDLTPPRGDEPTRLVHADGLVLGDGAPLADGAVVVSRDGTVVDVGPASSMRPRHAGLPVERVHGVVFPGLVNAHAHVELSAYRGRVTGGRGFVDWVDRFIGLRNQTLVEDEEAAVTRGVQELEASATTAVGDVSNTLSAVSALARAGIGGAVFHEVFGMQREPALARANALEGELRARLGDWPTTDLAYAPSPHTLYTTHPDAVRLLLQHAREHGARASLHLAEHPGERRAVEAGDGPVVDWLELRLRGGRATHFWPRKPLFSYADELGVLAPDVLLIHLTDAREPELARLAERGSPVVFCPRSNLYIEAKLPPLLAARQAGIEAALGTDSLASNSSLDVLAEARALADRFPNVPARELLQMATWNGARALGRPDLGRLAKGARPGLAGVRSPSAGGGPIADPAAFLLKHVKAPRTWVVRRVPMGAMTEKSA